MVKGDHSCPFPVFLLLLLLSLRLDSVAGSLFDSLKVLWMCTEETPFLVSGAQQCSQYVMCVAGMTSFQRCPHGMIFNKQRLVCDWPTREDVKRCYGSIDGYTHNSCPPNSALLLPVPDSCAMYIDCSQVGAQPINDGHVLECPYPSLFSVTARRCVDFRQGEALCRTRPIPKSPCDYHQYQQLNSVSAVTCQQRHPSCVGMRDGIHPFSVHKTYGYFMRCFRERTIDVFSCSRDRSGTTANSGEKTSKLVCKRHIYDG